MSIIDIDTKKREQPVAPPSERCEVCRFSAVALNEAVHTLMCRRNPPNTVGTLVPIPNRITGKLEPQWRTATAHVQVQPESWCGEFQGQLAK